MGKRKYLDEHIDFIRQNIKGIPDRLMVEMFNDKFDINMSYSSLQNLKSKYRLKNELFGGQFIKGNNPWNSGTKGLTSANKTSFKKGNLPNNYRPVGSESEDKDGYIKIKTADPNKWELKHRVVWRKVNGEIPKSHAILFADGNIRNFELDNLILVSRAELAVINKNKLTFKDKNLTETGVNIARLMLKTSQKQKVKK